MNEPSSGNSGQGFPSEFAKGVYFVILADLALAAVLGASLMLSKGFDNRLIPLIALLLIGVTQFLVVVPACIHQRGNTKRVQGMLATAGTIFLINGGICGAMWLR